MPKWQTSIFTLFSLATLSDLNGDLSVVQCQNDALKVRGGGGGGAVGSLKDMISM